MPASGRAQEASVEVEIDDDTEAVIAAGLGAR